MPTVTSTAQLQSAMSEDIKMIVDNVSQQVLDKLVEIIREEVYEKYDPKRYIRQSWAGGFDYSWVRENTKIVGNTVTSRIYHDPMLLNLFQEDGDDPPIHGSNYKGIVWDIRGILADIIINGSTTGKSPKWGARFQGAFSDSRDFWTPFKQLFDNGTVDRMLRAAFAARGIKLV